MKMKKILQRCMLLTLTSAFALLSIPALALEQDNLVDSAGLLTTEQAVTLEQKLDEVSGRLSFDIVVVTTENLGGSSPMAYSDDYYDYNGYGWGEEHDGCLLLIHMDENRGYWISTCGFGVRALTDYDISSIGDTIVPYLSAGDYDGGLNAFCDSVEDLVLRAQNGDKYSLDSADSRDNLEHLNYAAPVKTFDPSNLIIGGLLGLTVALITVGVLKSQLKTVRRKAAANDYYVDGSLVMTRSFDQFMGRHVSRVKIERDPPSGSSSTHTSSSGRSHGGGGGHF